MGLAVEGALALRDRDIYTRVRKAAYVQEKLGVETEVGWASGEADSSAELVRGAGI